MHSRRTFLKTAITAMGAATIPSVCRAGEFTGVIKKAIKFANVNVPELSIEDAGRPLLLLDSTWRLLPQIEACLHGAGVCRTLPAVATAYPRISKISDNPMGGLASVEALYLARLLLGERDDSLLDAYYWRPGFIENLKSAGVL